MDAREEGLSGVTPDDSTGGRLLATAAALFRTKGYASSSTRELASLLGIRNASLYHYIAKKEDLLYAMCVESLNNMCTEVEAAIAEGSDPGERLRSMIRAHLATALADRDKHSTMLSELRSLSPERRTEVLRLRDEYQALVRRTIAAAQSENVLRQDMDSKYLALALLNLLNWSIFWFRPEGELTPDQLAGLLSSLFLEGAAKGQPPPGASRPRPLGGDNSATGVMPASVDGREQV